MGWIRQYYTPKGSIIEVDEERIEGSTLKNYTFILHEKKPAGEQITLLQKAKLYSPDFWLKRYKELY